MKKKNKQYKHKCTRAHTQTHIVVLILYKMYVLAPYTKGYTKPSHHKTFKKTKKTTFKYLILYQINEDGPKGRFLNILSGFGHLSPKL